MSERNLLAQISIAKQYVKQETADGDWLSSEELWSWIKRRWPGLGEDDWDRIHQASFLAEREP